MKTKILIWGTGIFSKIFVEKCLDKEKTEILAFVESVKSKDEFEGTKVIRGGAIRSYSYDLIIVISSYLTEIRKVLLEYEIDLSNCLFTSDVHNWLCCKENSFFLINILKDNYIQNGFKLIIENQKVSSYSIAETHEGLAFLGNYSDDIIGGMIDTGNVYSYDEIEAFLYLCEKFYAIRRDEDGYFFDCGCNILTTSIYVLHKMIHLKAIGFEPVKRTYMIAKANAALNDMDERITVINRALSNRIGNAKIKCNQYSCGGNYITTNEEINIKELEDIQMTSLDLWIEESNFDISKIKFLWTDTEGYEGYVLEGMMSLLSRRKIPMYLEFYTELLDRSGCRDILLNCLEKIYSKYIVVKRGGIFDVSEIHAIKELKEIRDMNENIFLIS